MFRRPHYIALSLVVLLVLIVLNLPQSTAARLKLAFGGFFLPLFGLASSAQSLTAKAGDAVVPRRDLIRELEQLRQANQQLQLQARQGDEVLRENARLRQLVGFQKQSKWKLKPAHVIGRDPANWWHTVFIDLGSREGVLADMPVLAEEGLVGRITEVGYTRSQVVLLGDPNCRVSALIQETGDHGVISPGSAGTPDSGLVNLTHLSRAESKPGRTVVSAGLELKPGQTVISSGLGSVFPKGIPIGQLVDKRIAGFGLYTEARVKLAANFNALEEVWVMFP